MVDVVVLGINSIGERVYRWLVERSDANVLALVTEDSQYQSIRDLNPQLLISAGFRNIVPQSILDIPELGAVNLHKSYLPHNRGSNPNVWSIIEDAPAGVSMHYMTEDVDGGPILDRRHVPVKPDDDGRSLYKRLEEHQMEMFRDNWRDIREGDPDTIDQDPDEGSHHRKEQFTDLLRIDLDETVRAGDLIDRLRALTFKPYKNAYFINGGDRYFVELDISAETDVTEAETEHWNIPEYPKKGA